MKCRLSLVLPSALCLLVVQSSTAQTWIQLAPSGVLPYGRVGPSAVFSPSSNRLIVFGGETVHTSSPYLFLNDVWILSGANGTGSASWQQAIPQGAVGSPPPRELPTACYDQTTNLMIVFGGQDGSQLFNDVWVLVGADGTTGTPTWTRIFPSNPPPPRIVVFVYRAGD